MLNRIRIALAALVVAALVLVGGPVSSSSAASKPSPQRYAKTACRTISGGVTGGDMSICLRVWWVNRNAANGVHVTEFRLTPWTDPDSNDQHTVCDSLEAGHPFTNLHVTMAGRARNYAPSNGCPGYWLTAPIHRVFLRNTVHVYVKVKVRIDGGTRDQTTTIHLVIHRLA